EGARARARSEPQRHSAVADPKPVKLPDRPAAGAPPQEQAKEQPREQARDQPAEPPQPQPQQQAKDQPKDQSRGTQPVKVRMVRVATVAEAPAQEDGDADTVRAVQ